MLFCRGQHKLGVGRRLFQGFQQRVEGCGGEHVDLVDDVDFEATFAGGEVDLIA